MRNGRTHLTNKGIRTQIVNFNNASDLRLFLKFSIYIVIQNFILSKQTNISDFEQKQWEFWNTLSLLLMQFSIYYIRFAQWCHAPGCMLLQSSSACTNPSLSPDMHPFTNTPSCLLSPQQAFHGITSYFSHQGCSPRIGGDVALQGLPQNAL